MTDFSAARTAMVDRQIRPSDVTRLPVIDAMLALPREAFAPRAEQALAYADAPLPIGEGRWMLEPRTLAKMLDAAGIQKSDLVMVVGAGSGYAAAAAARMAAAVVALEENETLAGRASATLQELEIVNVMVETGALTEGCAASGPYDVILIEGGIETAPPKALLEQLAPGGRLLAIRMQGPVGRCALWTGPDCGGRPVFDATAPLLPGFSAQTGFAF